MEDERRLGGQKQGGQLTRELQSAGAETQASGTQGGPEQEGRPGREIIGR